MSEKKEDPGQKAEDGGIVPLQLTPTTIWWLSASGSAFAKIVSLGNYGMTTNPPFAWTANKEHWFVPNGTNLSSVLSGASQITASINYQSSSPNPDQQFIQMSGAIVSTCTFQFYAKSQLALGDWIAGGPPSLGLQAYYYRASGSSRTRPRILFDIDPATPGQIKRVSWVTQDKYTGGFSSNFTATKSQPDWNSSFWHYPTTHP